MLIFLTNRYPSLQGLFVNERPEAHYEFLGRLLGKAVYDGMLINVPLAGFFLCKLLGLSPDVNDLATLDPDLHRNLMYLKVVMLVCWWGF
jgi:ubiquitin-protein ligase E3 C